MDHLCTFRACIPEITESTSVVIRVTLPSSSIRIMLQFLRVLARWATTLEGCQIVVHGEVPSYEGQAKLLTTRSEALKGQGG